MSKFVISEVVEHKLNFEYLFVTDVNTDGTYLCRTKRFELIDFAESELQKKR